MDTKNINSDSKSLINSIEQLKASLRYSAFADSENTLILPFENFTVNDSQRNLFDGLYSVYKEMLSNHQEGNRITEKDLNLFNLKADNFILRFELSQLKQASSGKEAETVSDFNGLEKSVRNLNDLYANNTDGITEIFRTMNETDWMFKSMIMQSPTAMAVFKGEDLLIEIANKAMLKIWRKDFNEIRGQSIISVFPELTEQKYPEILRQVMSSGKPYSEEESLAYIDSHDGRKSFYFNYEYAPFTNPEGNITGIMCTAIDVTANIKNRKLKEAAQARLNQLVETLPVAMYTLDSEGYIRLYNKAAVALWGRKPEIGKDKWCGCHKITSIDGIEIPVEEYPITKALLHDETSRKEVFIYRSDGEKRHIIVHPQPLYDENSSITGASNVLIDITDSIEAGKKLNNSEEKFRLLSASIPHFIWTINNSGNTDYINKALLDYSGLSRQEFTTNAFKAMVYPDDAEVNRNAWDHSFTTGNDYNIEHRLKRYDGVYRWYQCRAIAQKDDQGNILQWIGTSIDIHERKTFQNRLETIVEERTLELKKANVELENMNKELSSFAYISSHDLQEPLRKIQTFASIILDSETDNLSETGKYNFSRMQVAAAQMTKLINDLLTYSRTKLAEKVFEEVDVNLLLSEIAEEFSENFEAGRGNLTIGKLPVVMGIPFQLKQLFTNLFSNAVKFKKQDIPLVINVSSQEIFGNGINSPLAHPNQKYQQIQFQDNGIGFKQEYADKIFEVFQRLHPKNKYEGTGIGLAICAKIAENHQAIIEASSKPGEGALFTINFPV